MRSQAKSRLQLTERVTTKKGQRRTPKRLQHLLRHEHAALGSVWARSEVKTIGSFQGLLTSS